MASSPTFKIHGRTTWSIVIEYTDEKTNEKADLSDKILIFECARASFRKPFPDYVSGARTERSLHLNRDEIAKLSEQATDYVIIDETVPGCESVIGDGKIQRVGWTVK
jgi:hypothetical protein